jgi:peptide/nickel transport system substrate-binding protein
VVDQIAKLNNRTAQVLNCGFVSVPGLGPWCRDRPFERFDHDPARSRSLLTLAGFDCSATPCVKDGKTLQVEYVTNETSTRRIRTQEILIAGVRESGFELVRENIDSESLFGDLGLCFLGGKRPLLECTIPASVDPLDVPLFGTLPELFACDAIATRANGLAGYNRMHWCNPEADRVMQEASRELDAPSRVGLMNRLYELQAGDAIGLPLYAVPAVSVWRSDRIAGPIGFWNGTPYGLFFNMDEWFLVTW